jgi:hypothetical protein
MLLIFGRLHSIERELLGGAVGEHARTDLAAAMPLPENETAALCCGHR